MAEVYYRVIRADGEGVSSQKIPELQIYILMGVALYSDGQPIIVSVPRAVPDWLVTVLHCGALVEIVPEPGDQIMVNRMPTEAKVAFVGVPGYHLTTGTFCPGGRG